MGVHLETFIRGVRLVRSQEPLGSARPAVDDDGLVDVGLLEPVQEAEEEQAPALGNRPDLLREELLLRQCPGPRSRPQQCNCMLFEHRLKLVASVPGTLRPMAIFADVREHLHQYIERTGTSLSTEPIWVSGDEPPD